MEIKVNKMGEVYYKGELKKDKKESGVSFESLLDNAIIGAPDSGKKVNGARFFTGNRDKDKKIETLLDNFQKIVKTDVNEKKYYKPNGMFDINQILKDNEGCFNSRNIKQAMDDVMGLWKCGILDNDDMLEAIKWIKLKEYSLHLELENKVRSSEIISSHKDKKLI